MSNSLVDQYRTIVPNDPRSDDELTQLFGQQNDQDGRYNTYPDFVQDYNASKGLPGPDLPPRQPGMAEEFTRGVSRGTSSLESTAAGLGALAASAVGADRLKRAALQKYRDIEEQSAQENAPTVGKVEDVTGPESAARFILGKAGELVPNVAEAGMFAAAGAAAGTAAEPGAGTVAGGATGALEGFLARKAAKNALRALIDKGAELVADKGARELAETQLSSIVRNEAVGALSPAAQHLFETEAGAVAKKFGADAANLVNFYAQGAGGEYGKLQGEDDAATAAAIAGLGSAGSILLPAAITSKLFPGVSETVANDYVRRLAVDAAKEVPLAAGGMGLMEVGNIAADRYANPETRDQPLTSEELSRILNASVVGAIAGGAAAPLTAIKGPQRFDPVVERHFGDIPDDRRVQIQQIKWKVDRPGAAPTTADIAERRSLTGNEETFYQMADPMPLTTPVVAGSAEKLSEGGTPEPPPEPQAKAPSEPAGTGAAPAASEPPAQPVPDTQAQIARKRAAAAVNLSSDDPLVRAAKAKVKAAAAQTETKATLQQRLAGNYPKGKLDGAAVGLPGLTISIETPKGTERSGVGPTGTPWKVEMPADYGYFLGTKGPDKDHVDVNIGPNPLAPDVYVVDQVNLDGKYDEPKVMLGFGSQEQAKAAYDASFSDGSGPQRRAAVTTMTKPELKAWLKDEKATKQPLSKDLYGSKQVAEPVNAGGTQPEVAPKLERQKATANESSQGVPPGQQGQEPQAPPGASAPVQEQGPLTEGQRVLSKERPQPKPAAPTELDRKIESIKGELGDLLKEWDALGPDLSQMKLSLNPKDFLGLDPKAIAIISKVALKALELGAYKFEKFAKVMIDTLGKKVAGVIASVYEHIRDQHPELKDKLTPRSEMADKIDGLAKKLGEEEKPEIHPGDQPVTVRDIDFEGRGTRDVSARGRDSNTAAKLWDEERARLSEQVAKWSKHKREAQEERIARKLGRPTGKPVTKANYAYDLLTKRWDDLDADQKDGFIQSLPESVRKEIQEREAVVKEPAYFVPNQGQKFEKLAEQLTSDSAPEGRMANTVTHRLVDIRDDDTGKIHRVSVWEANRSAGARPEDYIWVTKTDKAGEIFDGVQSKGRDAVKLSDVLAARAQDGSNRYRIVGSLRTERPTQYYHSVYDNRETYNKSFAQEAMRTAKAVQAGARAEEVKMETHGKELGAQAVEDRFTGQEEEPTTLKEGHEELPKDKEPEPRPLDLEPNEVKRLRDELPHFDSVEDLAELVSTPAIGPELYDLISKIAGQDKYFFNRVERYGLEGALEKHGYNIETGEGRQNEPGAVREAQAGVRPAGGGERVGNGEPQTDLESGKNRTGEQGQASQAGNEKPNRIPKAQVESSARELTMRSRRAPTDVRKENLPPGAEAPEKKPAPPVPEGSVAGAKLRTPEGQQNVSPEHAALVQSVHAAAQRAGISVDAIKGNSKLGAYDPESRTIYHVLGDQVGSEDVTTAFHEVGHDVFANEPKHIQDRILSAVDRLSDEALGVDTSADSRIRSADPANIGKAGVNEERLVESVAKNLADEGFSPDEAKGFSQKFVRSLKDLYMRAAMEVQRWLGWEPSTDLAYRYFENRVKRLLAGDTSPASLIDWLGVGKWSVGKRREFDYPSTRTTAERFSHDGQLVYETVPDLSAAGVRFNLDASNTLKFRRPGETDPYSRVTDVERRAAVINHAQDLIAKASEGLASRPELAEDLKETTPEQYLRKLFKLPDPKMLKDLLDREKETDGTPVEFNPEKRIDDFEGKANRDQTYREAYTTTQGLINRGSRMREEASEAVAQAEGRMSKLEQSLSKLQGNLKELKEIRSDKSKEVKNAAMLEGKYKQRVAELRRDRRRIGREVANEKVKISAIDAAMPAFTREHARLSAELQVRPDFVFRDQAPYNVPKDPNTKSEDLIKTVKTLALDSTGKMTRPEEVQADLQKMKEFLAHREEQARLGDSNALDSAYQAVNQQFHELYSHKNFSTDVAPFSKWSFAFKMLGDGRRMAEAFGTRAARSVMQRLNHYTSLIEGFHSFNERNGRRTGQLEDELLKLAPGMDRDHLRNEVLNPVRDELKRSHDLEELYAKEPNVLKRELFNRVRTMLLTRESARPYVEKTIDQFMPRLQRLIDHQDQMSRYWVSTLEKAGLGVEDTRLKGVLNPATGQRETATRRHLGIGAYSLPRKLGRNFSTMVRAMRGSQWDALHDLLAGGEDKLSPIEEAYEESPDAARTLLSKFFSHPEHSDQVQNEFFRNICEMSTESAFDAPGSEGNMRADPSAVKDAINKAGANDPVGFAERLAEAYGEPNKGKVLADVMRKLYGIYNETNGMFRKYEPSDAPEGQWAIKGMSPDALIDARTIEHLPGAWFDYHAYDRRESFAMSQRLAAEIAFGRGQEGLAGDFETLNKEVTAARTRVAELTKEAKRNKPTASQKEIDSFLKQKLGDKYDATVKQSERYKMVDEAVRGLSTYFRKDMAQDPTFNWLTRSAHTLGMMLVNQPASAINMLEQLFGLHLRYGAGGSVLNATGQVLKSFTHDAIGSLAQAIGIQMGGAWDHQLYKDLGLTDPDVVQKWHDALDRQQGETLRNQLLRGMTETMGMGINRVGDQAQFPLFRPLQPFTMSALLSDKALTQGLWRYTAGHVARATEYFKAHPDALEDKNFKLTAEQLGLKGLDKDGFNRLTKDLQDWGANFDDMVRGSIERADGKPFSNEEALRLYAMSLAQVSSESSLSTMPTGFYNNPIIKLVAPLLGWSFRRSQAVADLVRSPQGRYEMMSIASALAGLSVAAGGGLGVSALVNLYSENLLGKKRNLRPLLGPDAGSTALGVMENLNRVGTLGIFGELANGLVNVGTGGDNRVFDVDKRVVALSALGNLQDAISSMVNQHQADYAHVIRPLFSSMGGGGMLQYMQLANRALGLDNPESRVVARTNARNWLRAAGRDLDMDVREAGGAGGYSNATTISPSLTRMELAAYAEDGADFRAAYVEAVQAAKESGNPDPVDYVKRAFTARNPLKSIFRTAPSQAEYRRLLSAMPVSGANDVQEAVNAFNRFSEQIGARPFEGRTERTSQQTPPAAFRERALAGI